MKTWILSTVDITYSKLILQVSVEYYKKIKINIKKKRVKEIASEVLSAIRIEV